jgi:isopentenyl diphosphate isomerase/L-lactate dehydrogenase-like FMN-dependent dehydrogenase
LSHLDHSGRGRQLALIIIRKELDTTMALCGCHDILHVDRAIIDIREETRELNGFQ